MMPTVPLSMKNNDAPTAVCVQKNVGMFWKGEEAKRVGSGAGGLYGDERRAVELRRH